MKIGRNWFRTRFFENKKVLKSPDLRRWDWCDAERKGTRKILIGPDPISSSRFLGFPLSFWQKWKKQFSSKSRDFDFLFFSVSVSLFNFFQFFVVFDGIRRRQKNLGGKKPRKSTNVTIFKYDRTIFWFPEWDKIKPRLSKEQRWSE